MRELIVGVSVTAIIVGTFLYFTMGETSDNTKIVHTHQPIQEVMVFDVVDVNE
jgi:hypothetical protein